MRTKKTIWFFVILVFVIPAIAWVGMDWYESRVQTLPVLGPATDSAGRQWQHTIADFRMMNQEGDMVSAGEWKEKVVVVDFFFTHCPAICPKLTASLKKIQEQYRSSNRLLFCSFTVDPERDSATALKQYAVRFGLDTRNWQLLTGRKKDIYKLARNSFMVVATDGDGGPTDFIHTEKLVLIDQQKRIRGYYTGTDDAEVQQLIADIRKLNVQD